MMAEKDVQSMIHTHTKNNIEEGCEKLLTNTCVPYREDANYGNKSNYQVSIIKPPRRIEDCAL